MFRSKQQNQPTKLRSIHHVRVREPASRRTHRSEGASLQEDGGWRSGGHLIFYQVFLPGPTRGSVGPVVRGCSPEQEEQPAGLDLGCRRCQRRDRHGEGVGFSSQGFGCVRSPPHPCLPLWASATPPASPPTPVSCKPEEEELAAPETVQPTSSSPGLQTEHQGLMSFQNSRAPRAPPHQGAPAAQPGVGGLKAEDLARTGGFLVPFLEEALGLAQGREGQPHRCSWNRGTELAGAWLHGEVGVTVLWVWTARPSRESKGVGEGLGGLWPSPLLPDQVPGWPQTVGSREEPLARQGELESGKQQKRTKDVGSQHGSTVS